MSTKWGLKSFQIEFKIVSFREIHYSLNRAGSRLIHVVSRNKLQSCDSQKIYLKSVLGILNSYFGLTAPYHAPLSPPLSDVFFWFTCSSLVALLANFLPYFYIIHSELITMLFDGSGDLQAETVT